MIVTVFEDYEHDFGFEPKEVGKGTKLIIGAAAPGSVVPEPLRMGPSWLFPDHTDLKVLIEDWKTPKPTGAITPLSASAISDEVRNRDLVIAALIHMMGGAVTIQPHEMENARQMDLRTYQMQDPFALVIRTE